MERPHSVNLHTQNAAAPVIVGAGIGGLALALFMAQRGLASRLYEREHTFSPMGNGLQLGPNVSALLRQHLPHLEPALAQAASEPEALCFYDGVSGQPLKALPLGATAKTRWGAPFRVIHRADLHSILLAAAKDHPLITLHQGYALNSLTQQDAHLTLTFAHNGQHSTCDPPLVIGADGIRSMVRQALDSTPAHLTGQKAWRALIPAQNFPYEWGKCNTGLWMAPRSHLVHYPVRQGTFINAVLTTSEEVTELRTQTHFGLEVQHILEAAPEGWTEWPLHTHTPHFGKGNILLLGDASHAMLPHLAQGAAQAIEDAACLADLIARGIPQNTLCAAYTSACQKRIARIQKASASKGRAYRMGAPFSIARNAVLRLTPTALLLRSMDWLFKPESQ